MAVEKALATHDKQLTGVWQAEKSAVVLETSDQGHDIHVEISVPGLNRTLRIHAIRSGRFRKRFYNLRKM